jgi:hypothetical protein
LTLVACSQWRRTVWSVIFSGGLRYRNCLNASQVAA